MYNNHEEILTIQEAAKLLNLKPVTLRKWDREGKLKAIRFGSRGDRRYKKSDLMSFLDDASKTKKVQWQEYVRSGATYRIVYPVFDALTTGSKKLFNHTVDHLMAYFEENTLFWYYEADEIVNLGSDIVKQLLASKKKEAEFFKLWNDVSIEFLDSMKENAFEKLKLLSDKDLAKVANDHDQILKKWYGVTMSTDGTDETLAVDISTCLKNILKKKLDDKYTEKEFMQAYEAITQPNYLSYLSEERKLMMEIARDLKNGKIIKGSAEFNERVNFMVEKYWWTELGWARGKAKSKEDVEKHLDEILHSKNDLEKEIHRLENYVKKAIQKKQEIIAKYSLEKESELNEWLRLNDEFVWCHDFRKEVQMKSNFWQYSLLDEIAKRLNVPAALLEWCDFAEMSKFLDGEKINLQELNQRASKFLVTQINGKKEFTSGKDAIFKHQKTLERKNEKTKDLQGMSASGGRAAAIAFVAITADAAMNISEGQILVTSMTTPDFVPAMKKAAAIVTDEGGITCHAAIISRELGIPCIVGTKQATRTIKTGDLIDVAANHGVVRILESAQ